MEAVVSNIHLNQQNRSKTITITSKITYYYLKQQKKVQYFY